MQIQESAPKQSQYEDNLSYYQTFGSLSVLTRDWKDILDPQVFNSK
jgi:hypothetical protein